MEEEKLVENAQQGDAEAFGILYRKYEKKLFSYISSRINSHQDTQNILSETFVKVLQNINNLKNACSFRSWIYKICHRLIIDHYKKDGRSLTLLDDIDLEGEQFSCNKKREFEALEDCLGELEKREREIIILYHKDNENLKFIGKIWNISFRRVSQIVKKSTKKLRVCLTSKLGLHHGRNKS